jgi:hypothetical protein
MATNISTDTVTTSNVVVSPQTNKPGSPTEGQVISGTGTGNIAKGVYRYTGSSWESLDNAQVNPGTLKLIMSTNTNAVQFSAALNSTSTAAGNTNAIPHETSTGTGMLGTLEVPSTGGDALLTEFDANRVFRYYSAGANNNNDYFGITVDIPAETRGENIVIKFKYRTEEATVASSNGDFQVSVWDKSNGVKTTSTDTSAVTAGSAITVASSTGMAVGDKIWLESGGNAVNNVGNSITQAYVTEVTSGTSIKISETWTPASTAGSLVVSGWLSDTVSGLLPEADSDTNKIGKDYSIAVKTEEDTDQVVVWFSNKSTTTNVIELFFDSILVSQNKFLQASAKPGGSWSANFSSLAGYSTSFACLVHYTNENFNNVPENVAIITNDSSTGFFITAIVDCDVSAHACMQPTSTADEHVAWSLDLSAAQKASPVYNLPPEQMLTPINKINTNTPVGSPGGYFKLKAGEIAYLHADGAGWTTGNNNQTCNITIVPQSNDVIILESQDEIFTDWQMYTPTITGAVAGGGSTFMWRRVGSNMEIVAHYLNSTTSSTTWSMTLPSGYSISTKLNSGTNYQQAGIYLIPSTSAGNHGGAISYLVGENKVYRGNDQLFNTTSTFNPLSPVDGNAGAAGTAWWTFSMSLPIQGWNTNFNPLLSMPLVNLGTDVAEYAGSWAAASAGYRKYVNAVTSDTVTNSGLGTITAGTSTTSFYFQASVDCIVSFNYSYGQNAGVHYYQNILRGSAAAVIDTSVGSNDVSLAGMRMANTQYWAGYNNIDMIESTFPVKAGEYVAAGQSATATDYGGIMNSQFHMTVQRDRGNTNMAHIIKPAVAYAKDIKVSTDDGGGSTSGSWQTRTLQTLEGETWFMSLASNIVTLEPGTYKIKARYLISRSDAVASRLYSTTDSATLAVGNTGSVGSGDYISQEIECLKTFTASHSFTLQYRVQTTAGGGDANRALGMASGDSGSTDNWCAASVRVEKLK